jgi:hypothetical protein
MRRDAAETEGYRIRRERCAEKNGRDFEPEDGTVMRGIATFAGLCAVEAPTLHISFFFYSFNGL